MLTSKSNKVNNQKLESEPKVQTQMYDDSIGTTTYCMIICMKSRLTSFSYYSVIEGCISVKCQLLTVNFVGFGCQPGFRLHTSRQSFEPSYTQIQALLVFFLSFALASQPLPQISLKSINCTLHMFCQKSLHQDSSIRDLQESIVKALRMVIRKKSSKIAIK